MTPYETGYRTAWREIQDGIASFIFSKERGLYPLSQASRTEWDQGYDACVCAYRLGHDVARMIEQSIFEPSLFTTAALVTDLLDGTWQFQLRPDPRKR